MSADKETLRLHLKKDPGSDVPEYQWADLNETELSYFLTEEEPTLTEAEVIQKIKHLRCKELCYQTVLDADDNDLSRDTDALVLSALVENTSVTHLSHEDCDHGLNPQAESAFINLILHNKTLRHISLWNIMLTTKVMEALAQRLASDNPLISLKLRLDSDEPGEQGHTESFGLALSKNKTLTELDLREQNLSPQTLVSIANALETNQTLKTLHILGLSSSSTKMPDAGDSKRDAEGDIVMGLGFAASLMPLVLSGASSAASSSAFSSHKGTKRPALSHNTNDKTEGENPRSPKKPRT